MIKKLSIVLLFATGYVLAAADDTFAEEGMIQLYDGIIRTCVSQAEAEAKEAGQELSGTVPIFYRLLREKGLKHLLSERPDMVAKARTLLTMLGDTEMFYGDAQDVIEAAQRAKATALALPSDASQDERLNAWKNELKAYSVALITLLKREAPENFVAHPLLKERILANNGLEFDKDAEVALGGGTLAVLAGFDERRKVMGPELFGMFVNNTLSSTAHKAIASIK